MLMTDQDHDGSHIKGLVLNLFHVFFPNLLQTDGFLQCFNTPIVKVTKGGKKQVSFETLAAYGRWREDVGDAEAAKWDVKYYKGLGTSTSAEAREYFARMDHHLKMYSFAPASDSDAIDLAFNKARAEDRRAWLLGGTDAAKAAAAAAATAAADDAAVPDDPQALEMALAAQALCDGAADGAAAAPLDAELAAAAAAPAGAGEDDTTSGGAVSLSDFIHNELVLFSHADNVRSIPSAIDGLKPTQRKVLFACFKKNVVKDAKVAQLAG